MLASAETGRPRRILGIDPGLRATGFGLIVATGGKLQYIASGCVRNTVGELPERLKVIIRDLGSVIIEHGPTEVAIEKVFVNINPHSTLLLGQARGACVTALVACDLAVAEYTALQMKQSVAGHGKAAKTQVQEMVKRLLNLPGLPGKDAADALGLAICHAHAGASFNAMSRVTTLSRKSHAQFRKGRSY